MLFLLATTTKSLFKKEINIICFFIFFTQYIYHFKYIP